MPVSVLELLVVLGVSRSPRGLLTRNTSIFSPLKRFQSNFDCASASRMIAGANSAVAPSAPAARNRIAPRQALALFGHASPPASCFRVRTNMSVLTHRCRECNGCAVQEESGCHHSQLGLSCALSTPFRHDARVDTTRLADHAKWCLAQGCDSITLFGTTGEGASVDVADRAQSIKALLAGIAPAQLLSGVTACAADDAAAQARVATDAGLHGLLLTPPWYFRDVSDDGLFAWFARVLEAIGNARNVISTTSRR